jgi:hypothetical protein
LERWRPAIVAWSTAWPKMYKIWTKYIKICAKFCDTWPVSGENWGD